MSAWREETVSDLEDATRRIESVIGSVSGEPSDEQLSSVWRAYVDVEKSIAFIKVEIGEENPGRFLKAKLFSVPDERQALQFALRKLRKGTESFNLGDFKWALADLRESRNYLRVLLREKRLQKTRKARQRSG